MINDENGEQTIRNGVNIVHWFNSTVHMANHLPTSEILGFH